MHVARWSFGGEEGVSRGCHGSMRIGLRLAGLDGHSRNEHFPGIALLLGVVSWWFACECRLRRLRS